MGTFGNEFWNVADLPRYSALEGASITNWLDEVCELAQAMVPPGVIVYLPPRQYLLRRSTRPNNMRDRGTNRQFEVAYDVPDLWVRPNITLWFAPGARLILESDVVVRIDGPMRAEMTHIFECRGADSTSQRRGRVLLHSTKIAEVYPEWWGAIPTPDDQLRNLMGADLDDTDALVDCIRAAHADRAFPRGNTMPTIPIVLRGKYLIRREVEVSARGTQLPPESAGVDRGTIVFPETGGVVNANGLVLLGRRGVGGANAGFSSLKAGADFSPTAETPGVESMPKGRALLRIDGLHGSIIDGVFFDGSGLASVGMQITGNNARSTVFRGCSFIEARHVLAQVGDYAIADGTVIVARLGLYPRILPGLNPGWDLSGLVFEDCTFESGVTIPDVLQVGDRLPNGSLATSGNVAENQMLREQWLPIARRISGIVFQAGNTLPMTLDSCLFVGGMAACVEAYGGTLVVRGGGAQNQATSTPYQPNPQSIRSPLRFERPRGGVDFFIGSPLLRADNEAPSPTGLTILQFESQSDQLLDTFRHVAAAAGRTPFYPSVLQGVSHKATQARVRAPPSIVWAGPGISRGPGAPNPAPLTLVGCIVAGQRSSVDETYSGDSREPAGVILVDARAFLVNDVGTRTTNPSAGGTFYTRSFNLSGTFTSVPTGPSRPPWFRSM